MSGKVGVGYRLFNEVFLGMALSSRHTINDYALITRKVSEFLYMPIMECVHGLALRRGIFMTLFEEKYWMSRFGN
jgi:hypothetical protein